MNGDLKLKKIEQISEGRKLERTVALPAVLKWLERADPRDATMILTGLSVDDGDAEEAFEILEIVWDAEGRARSIILTDGRKLALRSVAAIIDSQDGRLAAAVEAALFPGERAARDRRRQRDQKLAASGFVSRFASDEDAELVLTLAETLSGDAPTTYEMRHDGYLAITRGEQQALCRPGARLFRQLMAHDQAAARGAPAEDYYWRLVKLLHVAGELHEAAALDEMLWNKRVHGPVDRRLLATTMAAALLSLAEATHDTMRLRAAHRACGLAWSLKPDDEGTSNIFNAVKSAMKRAGIDVEIKKT